VQGVRCQRCLCPAATGAYAVPESKKLVASGLHGSNCGLRLKGKPVFSVQYHPEASPGPEDSHYLFTRFVNLMREQKGLPLKKER
jgi:carbamoylphosphate synthase small subunit